MERNGKEVAVLLNDVWNSAVVKCEYGRSRILWIKFKFSRVKACEVMGYGPTEGDSEEKRTTWIV